MVNEQQMVGVDGEVDPAQDPSEVERAKATEELVRERSYLGREFLTWLLWRSRATAALTVSITSIWITGQSVEKHTLAPVSLMVCHA